MKSETNGPKKRGKQATQSKPPKETTSRRKVEALLRESEERYRLIVEHSPNAIALHQNGRLVFVNPAAVTLMRAAHADELIGKPISEIVHPDYLAPAMERLNRMLAGETGLYPFEEVFIRLDGSTVPVEVIAAPLHLNGQLAIQVIVTDITERKRNEESLQRQNALYTLLADNASDGVVLFGPDGTIAYMSPSQYRMLGYSEEEIIGAGLDEVFSKIHPDDRERIADRIRTDREERRPTTHYEFRVQRKDGVYIWVEDFIHRTFDEQGKVVRAIVNSREVTQRKLTEEALVNAEQRYRSLVENAVEGIFQSTPQGTFLHVNPAMAQLYGYDSPEDMLYSVHSIAHQIYVNEEDRERFIQLLNEHGRVDDFEAPNYRKDRSIVWTRTNARLILRDDGSAIYQGFLSDVTERRKAEQARADSEAIYRQAIEVAGAVPYFETYYDEGRKIRYEFIGEGIRQITGYGPEEFTASLWDTLVEEVVMIDDLADYSLDEAIQHVRNGDHAIWKCEHRLRARDGSVHWVFESAVELRDEKGIPYGSIGMYQDITERKLAEQQIRYQASLLENVSEAIISTDANFIVRSWNKGAELLYGWTEAEAVGRAFRDLVPTQYPDQTAAQVIAEFDQNGFWKGEVLQQHKDGRLLTIQAVVNQMKNAAGTVVGVVAVNRDVTERKQMEASLAQSEQRYRILYETMPSMNFTLDEQGNVLSVNQFGVEQLGFGEEELLGRPVVGLFHPDDQPGIVSGLQECLETPDQLHQWEKRKVRKDGSVVWVQEYVRAIADNEGLGKLLVTCYDITERKQAEEKIRRQVNFLTSLKDIDRVIISSFDLRLSLRNLVAQAVALLEADAADILLPNPVMHTLEYGAGIGFYTGTVQTSSVRFGESYAGRAAVERRIVQVPDLRLDPDTLFKHGFLKDEQFVSYYGVPLIVKGKVIGVMEVFHRTLVTRNAEWFDVLEALAGQAAIAIDNAKLFDDLKRSNFELALAYDATIEGWSRALDLRDKETEGHTQRVTQQTLELARRMGIPERELIQVRYGALLHDIGKMGVPDQILLKPGQLTPEEWEAMRQHPVFAFDLLSPIRHLKEAALDIPYCHHERWDGAGYPRGLKGEQIPFAARLFAVVDVWDAITSNRTYRQAWDAERAMAYIREQSGKQFDPRVVDEFLLMLQEKGTL